MLRGRLAGLALTLFMTSVAGGLMTAGAAHADPPTCHIDITTGQCVIEVGTPGTPGTPGGSDPTSTGGGHACIWDGTSQGISNPPPGPVPCTKGGAYWSNTYHCYISPVTPAPPATDPNWGGHYPDGAIYYCNQPQTKMLIEIWSANPPPNSGAGPTPGQVAQIAVDSMNLKAIDIGIVPKPGPNSMGLVGMPVWMWISNPVNSTAGPITASASAGGITVTATATLSKVVWDMGDGNTVTCDGSNAKGTEYTAADNRNDSPTCGYRYTKTSGGQPNNEYKVTASSYWVVQWSGAGQTGTIVLPAMSSSTQIKVGELQVLEQYGH